MALRGKSTTKTVVANLTDAFENERSDGTS